MAPLTKGLELLESAAGYALAGVALVTPRLLPRPTPCADWDLETLLAHLSDSIGVLHEAITARGVNTGAVPGDPGEWPDPVGHLRAQQPGCLARPAPVTSSSPSSAAGRS